MVPAVNEKYNVVRLKPESKIFTFDIVQPYHFAEQQSTR